MRFIDLVANLADKKQTKCKKIKIKKDLNKILHAQH